MPHSLGEILLFAIPMAHFVGHRRERDCEGLRRVHDESRRRYGADKVWRQLHLDGVAIAHCLGTDEVRHSWSLHGPAKSAKPEPSNSSQYTAYKPPHT